MPCLRLLYRCLHEAVVTSDAIDNGQNKKAIQLVDKVLKKTPNLHCAKVRTSGRSVRVGGVRGS